MASATTIIHRSISTSAIRGGKHNFRKFYLFNKAGNRLEKLRRAQDPNAEIDHRGVRPIGTRKGTKWIPIREMIPEMIVPSLENFHLKPYVSYQAEGIKRREFTAKDLFAAIYAEKIESDFKNNLIKPNGDPVNPSENELLTPNEAKIRAAQTGTDLFTEDVKEEC